MSEPRKWTGDRPTRDKVVEMVRILRENTTDRGCTPGEAAKFAAKAAQFIEEYQISEHELRAESGDASPEIEVCENKLRTGKKVVNPGLEAVVAQLARAMCCEIILLKEDGEVVYGITGDPLDTDYVCQISLTLVPALQTMAYLEGLEHGREKAGLVRWTNQYLQGASLEIRRRIEAERKERSAAKEAECLLTTGNTGRALMCVTGESIAAQKRDAVAQTFKQLYPKITQKRAPSRSEYDADAHRRGREAGKVVGLHLGIEHK